MWPLTVSHHHSNLACDTHTPRKVQGSYGESLRHAGIWTAKRRKTGRLAARNHHSFSKSSLQQSSSSRPFGYDTPTIEYSHTIFGDHPHLPVLPTFILSHSPTMANIVEDGENIEVDLGDLGLSTPTGDESSKQRFSFPFRQTKTVTPESSAAPITPESASATPSSPETREVEEAQSQEEEEDQDMFFKRRGQKLESHLFEEEEPGLLHSEAESDEQSLVEAETAEGLLGSALRMAEVGIGDNFLSIARSPRNDAVELGKRVSTFTEGPGGVDGTGMVRSPSLLSDDGSVHTYDSQLTETTFIKVPKVDPATITQETWGEIMGASISAEGGMEDVPLHDDDDDPPLASTAKSPPRTKRAAPAAVPREILGPASNRKWDKLRNTLEAQEKGTSVGYEAQLDPSRRKKPGSPQRMKRLSQGLRKSFQRTSKPKETKEEPSGADDSSPALLAVPPSKQRAPRSRPQVVDDKPFDVNIQVQDLSKKVDEQSLTDKASFDQSVLSQGASFDQSVLSQDDELQDPEEAESMEVVYLVSETGEQAGETLPPFPTKLIGNYI